MDAATILAAILGGFVLLILYFLLAHQNAKNYWKKRGIPQVPGSLPVVGNTLPLLTQTHNLITLMEELYNMNKDSSMVGYLHMFRPALLVRDPDLVKTVLQVEFQNFNENFLMLSPENDPLLCRNPFFSTGQFWIAGRKRLTYAFSSMRLKVLVESIRVVSHKLDAYIAKQLRGKDSLEVELKDLFARFTLEAVANAGFGMEGFSFDDEKHPGSLKEMAAKVLQPNTIDNIKFVLILSTPTLSKLLRLSFLSAEIDRYFRSLVKEIIRVRKEETVPRNDFFQLMSDLEKSEGEQIDIESMTAYCLSFLVDGYETSSTTLAYVGFVLAKYPDVQEKAREEVKSVLAKHKNTINYDCLKELTYMDQVISEAMRIYPTAGALTKMCTKETRLTGSDGLSCVIEKGTQVIIPVKGLHNDPKYWKDPEVFDPERFSKENAKDIRKFTYTPFGEGPRQCVGMRMAQMQMKAALTAVLDKYSLELSPRTRLPLKMDPQIGIIGNPLGGVWVYMKPLSA
ncbi:cytochrome P450 6j1-like [Prorops nasuta]|uniref:cytochrome P450 6j1-like n=1 Tax=Prorops nasuta TaxID=863751 RepID=UPI0034CE1B3B